MFYHKFCKFNAVYQNDVLVLGVFYRLFGKFRRRYKKSLTAFTSNGPTKFCSSGRPTVL